MKLSPRLRRILVTILAILTLGAPVATAPQASALDTCHSTDYSCLARWGYGPYVGNYADRYYYGGHHNCTRYVGHRLARVGVPDTGSWGNGSQWGASGRARGYQVDANPRPGSIGYASHGGFGHVAVVEQVSGDRVLVSEDNASGIASDPSGYARIHWYPKSWFSGYIHVPQLEAEYGSGGGGTPGSDPVGSFDTAVGGTGTVHVRGWSYDPDVLSHDVRIHIYIGGQAGTAGAQSTEIIANKARGDLRGTPAFDDVIATAKTGNQQVCAYAINVGGGNNKLLGCKNVTITATGSDPVGSFDTAVGGTGTVHVRGWSYDPDVLSHDVRIHIYIGGQAGTAGAQSTEIIANKARGDLRGTPAFDDVIATAKTGNQQVCAYAINVGGGNNKLLGCKNVTITARATTTNTPPPITTTPQPPGDEPDPQPGRQAGSSLSS